ncbi:chloroplast envelope membrane protein-like [Chenopodium quinoa]|uniref:chloroplast envelope membrane protein-like n=1 Tax=Chenopodium quinoa TaxID=63459 RepID=UPI000B77DC60|nr:chloroplast envelope membrane protein-like [Chenopodium quinoa]
MSSSVVLIDNFMVFNPTLCSSIHRKSSNFLPNFRVRGEFGGRNQRVLGLVVPNAKKKKGLNSRKKSWWQRFFFEEDGNWLGLREEDLEEFEEESKIEVEGSDKVEGDSEKEKFEAWKNRAEALIELREAQEGIRNEENRNWEDWLVFDEGNGAVRRDWDYIDDYDVNELKEDDIDGDPDETMPERGLVKTLENFILGKEDDDLLYEDRVFQFASRNSAKFLAILIIVPWAMDFLVHDYVLMPFLDRYVKTVPLAAELLDVRRSQKLEMVKELNSEKARLRFEVEIGKAPPLSEEETWWELRHKALELRDEWRLNNRNAFANIWSDMVFGVSVFLLLYFNQSKVALLKFTGYKIINNISDAGKAFLIILITDIFLGYHSESGWQTVCEVFVEHYGLEVDQSTITIFICLVPVIMDACVKLWLFKFLPRLSPKVFNIFHEMKRH